MKRLDTEKVWKETVSFSKSNQKKLDMNYFNKNNSIIIDKESFLSNFSPATISFFIKNYDKEVTFPSVEHYINFNKFIDFLRFKQEISKIFLHSINYRLNLKHSKNKISKDNVADIFFSKKISGKDIREISNIMKSRGYISANWEKIKLKIMVEALCKKFQQKKFFQKLKTTGDKYILYENDSYKKYWCSTGKNMIGVILMIIRRHI